MTLHCGNALETLRLSRLAARLNLDSSLHTQFGRTSRAAAAIDLQVDKARRNDADKRLNAGPFGNFASTSFISDYTALDSDGTVFPKASAFKQLPGQIQNSVSRGRFTCSLQKNMVQVIVEPVRGPKPMDVIPQDLQIGQVQPVQKTPNRHDQAGWQSRVHQEGR